MNRDTIQGQWKQLRGKIRQQWGNLSDDDVESVNGSYEELVGKIQEKYGVAKDKAERMVEEWKA